MGIRIIRKGKTHRRWWYGEYRDSGKLRRIKLNVRVSGKPPSTFSTKDEGDRLFEVSKAKAQKAFEDFMLSRQQKGNAEGLLESLIEAKTGEKVSYTRLDALAELWNGLARTRELTEGRKRNNAFVINDFAKFCGRECLYQVTAGDVIDYFNAIRKKLAWSSVKSRMSLLSGAFARFLPYGCANPFKRLLKRDTTEDAAVIHRVPLTNEQIGKVRELARRNEMLYGLFVCGLCTGARLKDICFMRKDNVDLKEGFVSFVASKTGTRCELPLFDEFRAVSEGIIHSSDPTEPLLFPEAAAMYRHNRSGLVRMGKMLFAEALFADSISDSNKTLIVNGSPVPPKTHEEVFAIIEAQNFAAEKTKRMKKVYELYAMNGKSYRAILSETGIPKGTVCGYLTELEGLTGDKIIRFEKGRSKRRALLSKTRIVRQSTNRAVSAYGWSCLRPTFCLAAIENGISPKQIMLAVGHKQYSTTLTFYDNPTREHQKQMWLKKASAKTRDQSLGSEAAIALLSKLEPNQLAVVMQRLRTMLTDNGEVVPAAV
ncbi:MAG: hypothetical protein IJH50_00125 [Kiritimatiellae bacterium]|nr:hypothetical protein [Kiritimatiellia bacterium]